MYVGVRMLVGVCAPVNACMRQSSWRAKGSQSASSCHHNTNCKSLHCPVMCSHDATAKGSGEIENEPPVLEPCFGTVVNESLVTSPPFHVQPDPVILKSQLEATIACPIHKLQARIFPATVRDVRQLEMRPNRTCNESSRSPSRCRNRQLPQRIRGNST